MRWHLVVLIGVLPAAVAHGGSVRVTRLAAGPRPHDCLASLELVASDARPQARTVVCHDGELACDRDGLVNGRCQFWTRLCFNQAGTCGPVASATVEDGGDDADLTMLGRTVEHVAMPAMTEACGAVTTLTVPLGHRANGSARKATKRVA